jgi:hypothetical protein
VNLEVNSELVFRGDVVPKEMYTIFGHLVEYIVTGSDLTNKVKCIQSIQLLLSSKMFSDLPMVIFVNVGDFF